MSCSKHLYQKISQISYDSYEHNYSRRLHPLDRLSRGLRGSKQKLDVRIEEGISLEYKGKNVRGRSLDKRNADEPRGCCHTIRVYWLAFLHTHFFKQTKDLLALGYEFLFRTFQAQFKGNNVRLPSSQILWQETFLVCFYPYCYTCDDCIINMDNTNSHMPLCLYRNNNKAF